MVLRVVVAVFDAVRNNLLDAQADEENSLGWAITKSKPLGNSITGGRDFLQRISDDKFKPLVHRVKNGFALSKSNHRAGQRHESREPSLGDAQARPNAEYFGP